MKKTKPRFHHFSLGRFVNRLQPSTCPLCGQYHADLLCEPCQQRHASNASVRCPRCAIMLTTQRNACHSCTVRPPSYDASFFATDYAVPIDNLVLALKFNAQLPLAAIFAERIMGVIPNAAVSNAALMVAVPFSSQRIAQRGFNQAHEIARHIARAW